MIKFNNVKFIKSAYTEADFIKSGKKIVAIAGKSNSGKSTLINSLAGNGKLARTSATPGKTRAVNYFDFGDFILADLPGYGYAGVSKGEKSSWEKMMQDFFFSSADCIKLVLVLSDIRRSPSEDDITMLKFLYETRLPFTVVMTKADKLGKSKIKPQVIALSSEYHLAPADIIPVSATSGYNKDALLKVIENSVKI